MIDTLADWVDPVIKLPGLPSDGVQLVDVMPRLRPEDTVSADYAIVEAARVSVDKCISTPVKDKQTLRYLFRNRHTSPFEMCELKFDLKMPIFLARQWVRHRTASINEVSGRYCELSCEQYCPTKLYNQDDSTKQGSALDLPHHMSDALIADIDAAQGFSVGTYQDLLKHGISREDARIVLPLSTMTHFIWKMDLHNLLHFCTLRCHKHAQYQIRAYADAIQECIKKLFPWTWEAWQDYQVNALTLSALDIARIQNNNKWAALKPMGSAEEKEFMDKLDKLGITLNGTP